MQTFPGPDLKIKLSLKGSKFSPLTVFFFKGSTITVVSVECCTKSSSRMTSNGSGGGGGGLDERDAVSSSSPSATKAPDGCEDVCVFLMNRTGMCISLNHNPQAVTAQEIINSVYHNLFRHNKKSSSSRTLKETPPNYFALWITSPLLEMQLKPLYRPYNVLSKWDELVRKYGSVDPVKDRVRIRRDEPILSFQRCLFLTKKEEMQIRDKDVLQLLYEEAKINVLDGRYPMNNYEQLASVQAAIDLGPYDSNVHTVEYFKERRHCFLPMTYRSGVNWSARVTNRIEPEDLIIEHYKKLRPNLSTSSLIRVYMEQCWATACYGSAFFHGQMEKTAKGLNFLINHFDVQVWVAVNHVGIHVIDKKCSKPIMTLEYSQFKWELGLPSNPSNPNSMPCIFLQVKSRRENRILQIFSRQARLIDSMIQAFVNEIEEKDIDSSFDSTNSRQSSDETVEIKPIPDYVSNNIKKLSYISLDDDDHFAESQGTLKPLKKSVK